MPLHRTLKKGQAVLYQGEAPASIHLVKKGLVRAYNVSENGEEKTLGLFGPQDVFPVSFAYGMTPVSLFYYETMVDTQIELYTKAEYAAHLAEHAHDETNRLAVQYVSALLQLNCIIQPLAYNRITHVLQFLCIRFGQDLMGGVYTKIGVPLTQLQIAQMAGVTRETAAIELGKLKIQGIVTVKSKFYNVHAKKLLQTITSKEIQSVEMN